MAYCSQNRVVIQKSRYVNNNKRIVYKSELGNEHEVNTDQIKKCTNIGRKEGKYFFIFNNEQMLQNEVYFWHCDS